MTRSEFLSLPWSDTVRQQLEAHMAQGLAEAYSAEVTPAGKYKARVWAENPGEWDAEALVYEVRPLVDDEIEAPAALPVSRTAQAIRLMQDEGWTAYRACKAVGVSQSAVSRALRRTPNRCETCGQPVKKS